MQDMEESKAIVVPGDVLDDTGSLKPGLNTYREGQRIYASRLGVKSVRGDMVNVVALSGRYDPQRGDMVIGTVVECGPSNWYINVGAPNDAGMHVNDVPWRVEFGETGKYLNIGDSVLLKVAQVDTLKKVSATMKDRQCRKLQGGVVFDVAPSKVPRLIGKNGSMIALIKERTAVRMFVGQNGVIWMDGEPPDVAMAMTAARMVEELAHVSGLTDRVKDLLSTYKPVGAPLAEEPPPSREWPPERRYERRDDRRDDRRGPRRDFRAPRGEFRERRGPGEYRERRAPGGFRGPGPGASPEGGGPRAGEASEPRERAPEELGPEDRAPSREGPGERLGEAPRRRRRRGGRGRRGGGSGEPRGGQE